MTETQTHPRDASAVLLVSEPLRPGGLTGFARTLFRGLRQSGLKVAMAAAGAPPAGFFEPAEAKHLGVFTGMLGSLARPFVFRRLLEWARERKPALIHGLSAFTAPACARLAEVLDVPYVLSVQHLQGKGDVRVDPRLMRVMVCNETLRENLVNDAKVPKELLRLVPLGIEIPAEVPPPVAFEGRWPVVATFAPLTASQDVATFVRAAKQVYDVRLGACQFLVVGEGPEETGLRKLARELKLEKHLTFAHAEVPQDRILPDVDVYVQTARQEAFGLGVLAAMAWGRPVVAASAGALIGLVEDGRTGCLVPPGDPDAFAEKILELLSDARRRAELGRQGRNRAEARYQLDAMLEGTLHIYGEARGLLTPSASGSTIARLLLK